VNFLTLAEAPTWETFGTGHGTTQRAKYNAFPNPYYCMFGDGRRSVVSKSCQIFQ